MIRRKEKGTLECAYYFQSHHIQNDRETFIAVYSGESKYYF